jgi:hypothetical protein
MASNRKQPWWYWVTLSVYVPFSVAILFVWANGCANDRSMKRMQQLEDERQAWIAYPPIEPGR